MPHTEYRSFVEITDKLYKDRTYFHHITLILVKVWIVHTFSSVLSINRPLFNTGHVRKIVILHDFYPDSIRVVSLSC